MKNTMRIGCESSTDECTNPETAHSEIHAPGKSDSKTHFFGNSRPQGDPTRRRPTKGSGMHDSSETVKIDRFLYFLQLGELQKHTHTQTTIYTK